MMTYWPGWVYLLHLDRPLCGDHPGRHYIGWTQYPRQRIRHHRNGTGAKMLRAARARGIGFSVARVWRGDRTLERRLKRRHESPRLCPLCGGHLGPTENELTPAEIRQLLRR